MNNRTCRACGIKLYQAEADYCHDCEQKTLLGAWLVVVPVVCVLVGAMGLVIVRVLQ